MAPNLVMHSRSERVKERSQKEELFIIKYSFPIPLLVIKAANPTITCTNSSSCHTIKFDN